MPDVSNAPSSSQPPPQAFGVGSAGGSAPEFGESIPVGDIAAGAAPEAPPPPPSDEGDAVATTNLMVGGIDALCQWLGRVEAPAPVQWSLSDTERAELARDLEPVLRKYGVEAIPFAEEMQAGITLVTKVGPRVRRWQYEKENADDRAGAGKEGRAQNRAATKADPPATGSTLEVNRLLE